MTEKSLLFDPSFGGNGVPVGSTTSVPESSTRFAMTCRSTGVGGDVGSDWTAGQALFLDLLSNLLTYILYCLGAWGKS